MQHIIVFRTCPMGTWREKYNGIGAYAKSVDWRLHPVDARHASPDVPQILDFWHPDGIIIDASGAPQMFCTDDFGRLPVVVMNPEDKMPGRPRPSISSDTCAITKLAASELMANNPASLVFLEWFIPTIRWSALKRKQMERIAQMHGIPFYAVTPAEGDADDPTRYADRVARALDRLPRPCGVFAATDVLGAAAISAATRLNARIPDEISVIAVDDDPEICENCSPTLTSVRPDFFQLGFSAGCLLHEAMLSSKPVKSVTIPPLAIVRRASTASTRTCDHKVHDALELIRIKACEGLTAADVADRFGLSRRMVEMRFKAATGRTIGDMILERRFAAAYEYLSHGASAISAIANFCGWNSDIAFRKAFKARFGTSPLKWRKGRRCAL